MATSTEQIMAVLLKHSAAGITRRDETIARLTARLDQVEAANQSLHSANARLIRENTTLRAERREGLR